MNPALDLANGQEDFTDRLGLARDRDTLEALAELRAVLRRLLANALADAPFGSQDVHDLNAAAAAVPQFPQLDTGDPDSPALVLETRRLSPITVALSAIARSGVELLGTEDRGRLAVCRAPGCGNYYLATRPDRVWCSAACGNRARVARHYRRTRTAGPGR
jgi:predicted RNA-binding Zn ribbon-like protein